MISSTVSFATQRRARRTASLRGRGRAAWRGHAGEVAVAHGDDLVDEAGGDAVVAQQNHLLGRDRAVAGAVQALDGSLETPRSRSCPIWSTDSPP